MLEKPPIEPKNELAGELSEEEKREIDEALATKDVFNLHPASSNLPDEEIKAAINAQQKILSFGSRGVDYLEQKLIKENPYKFSNFAWSMVGEENLETIANALAKDCVTKIYDGSSASQLNKIVQTLVADIRKNDPSDIRLKNVAEKMLSILNSINLGYKKSDYLQTLALTGTGEAREYFSQNEDIRRAFYLDYLEDVSSYRSYSLDRLKFKTWDDVLKQRRAVESNRNQNNFHPSSFDDPFDERELGSKWDEDITGDHYDENTYGPLELDEKAQETIDKANEIMSGLDIEETIKPLVRLYLFNQLHSNQDQQNIERAIKKINNLVEVERYCEKNTILSTIGIEIECHRDVANNQKVALVNALGVRNYLELDNSLWEFNPHFSYSALAQSRYLEELAKAGLVLLDESGERKKIPENHILSLHVNLGVPLANIGQDYLKERSHILSDVLNYAFTSANRMRERKTDTSVRISGADTSKKMELDENAGKRKKRFKEKKLYGSSQPLRLELRASEFRDYKTFIMLESIQRLGAMFFSHIKSVRKEKMTHEEIDMAKLWKNFEIEYVSIMRKHGIRMVNLLDKNRYAAAELAEQPDLPKECRQLIYKYARKTGDYLKLKQEPSLQEAA